MRRYILAYFQVNTLRMWEYDIKRFNENPYICKLYAIRRRQPLQKFINSSDAINL